MPHPCPVGPCTATDVPDNHLTCRRCWYLIPTVLQRAVHVAWRGGHGKGTPQHTTAAAEAIAAAEARWPRASR